MSVAITAQPNTSDRRPRWNDAVIEPIFVALTLLGIVIGFAQEQLGFWPETQLVVHWLTYFFGGFYAVRAIVAALRERTVEVDLLMVLAALGAAYVNAYSEGAVLLFLFSLSNVLQAYALRRTEKAITALFELRPDTATVTRDGEREVVPLAQVVVGDIMLLRPGDRVPLDGMIVRGSGDFDESALTGESMPVSKALGATVLAGTLNQTGALEVRVTKTAEESTLARIITMVSEAQSRKARTQYFLEVFEQRYAIGVIAAVALFVLLVPLLTDVSFSDNFYRGMVLLTVASPCALVIGVPASLLSAIAASARRGVLFKGGAHLEELATVKVVAFDKTGTLTYGRPAVGDLVPTSATTAEELLYVTARAELQSEHPIAHAIISYAAELDVLVPEPDSFRSVIGRGVRASWDGVETLVGSPRLFADEVGLTVPAELLREGEQLSELGRGTILYVLRGDVWLGLVTVMDRERDHVLDRLAELRAAGVERLVMLSGDSRRVADALGRRLGFDEVYAELLPEDKLRIIEELRTKHGSVVMVGDGVNDAPALAAASIGVAMGGAGTDAALETADVVLMADDLAGLAYAKRLAVRTQRVVWQNIIFALAVVVVLATLTLTIGVPLPLGVIGHEGSTILVVLNGLRLLAYR